MNDEQPRRTRRWVPILIGVLVLFGVLAVGATVLTVSWFRQNITITRTSEETAVRRFDEVRSRYPGQEPLIQLVDGRPQYLAERATQSTAARPLSSIHVLAYDRDEGSTVTFSLPFWLLRMKSGPIRLSAYHQGWDDRGVSFRVEDLEKHGPGIVLDVTEPNEGRVLIWAE